MTAGDFDNLQSLIPHLTPLASSTQCTLVLSHTQTVTIGDEHTCTCQCARGTVARATDDNTPGPRGSIP